MPGKARKKRLFDFSANRKELGALLKRERERRGWTQEEMPVKIIKETGFDISKYTIEKIEQGTINITVDKLWAYMVTLGFDPSDSFPE